MSEARGVPDIRLHQLEGFYHVALQGGFTRAAEAYPTPITQPALHQQVRKLERMLGRSLLVRGPELLDRIGDRPRFGWLRRRGFPPAGLVRAFCEAARDIVAALLRGEED